MFQSLLVLWQVKVIFHRIWIYLTKACEGCTKEKRKTINGDDLIKSMDTLGFDDYTTIL